MEPLKLNEVDNAIERYLLLALVAVGYAVDNKDFFLANDQAGYDAAVAQLADGQIDIYGVGSVKDRGAVKERRVIVDRKGTPRGEIGYAKGFVFDPIYTEVEGVQTVTGYKRYRQSEGLYDVEYEVRYICGSGREDRALNDMIINALGRRRWLWGWSDDLEQLTRGFYVLQTGDGADVSGDDYIEKVYSFSAKDIPLERMVYMGDVANIDELQVGAAPGGEEAASVSENFED